MNMHKMSTVLVCVNRFVYIFEEFHRKTGYTHFGQFGIFEI